MREDERLVLEFMKLRSDWLRSWITNSEELGWFAEEVFVELEEEQFRVTHSDQGWVDGKRVHYPEGHWSITAECSDTFAWGSADCEYVTLDNLDVLHNTLVDVFPLWLKEWEQDSILGHRRIASRVSELFAARVRGMRPQGACYKVRYPRSMWGLFNAAGLEREIDILNPRHIGA